MCGLCIKIKIQDSEINLHFVLNRLNQTVLSQIIGRIFAVGRGMPLFIALVLGEPLNSGCEI